MSGFDMDVWGDTSVKYGDWDGCTGMICGWRVDMVLWNACQGEMCERVTGLSVECYVFYVGMLEECK